MEPRIFIVAVELMGCGSIEAILTAPKVEDTARAFGVRIMGGVPLLDGLSLLVGLQRESSPLALGDLSSES